ncbi:MAG: hypothetical protein PHC38_05230 [Weeksellaceae bacterium]|nr:hypothetical protein [Weeksellaceae bacterium]
MQEITQLLNITSQLREKFAIHKRNFTLDGRLVGDIGEVLAAEKYGLTLLPENSEVYDGVEDATQRKVQIKASFKGYFQFPFGDDKILEFYLCLQIDENGELSEIYNGPGRFVYDNYIENRNLKAYKNSYYTLAKGILQDLNLQVPEAEKIKQKMSISDD